MAITTAQIAPLLEPGINALFGMEYAKHKPQWSQVFDTFSSSRAWEEDQSMPGFGLAAQQSEGQGVTYDSFQTAWKAYYRMIKYALAFSITEDAIDDNLYGSLMTKGAAALAFSMSETKEVIAAAIFNNAFSVATGGDGKELCATDHPMTGGGTFSNELATPADLSETSLEDLQNQMDLATTDRGLNIALMSEKLIIPPALRFTARRILGSPGRPGTGDNDINVHKDEMDIVVMTRLTDPDAWFIKTNCPDGLKHFSRKKLRTKMEGEFETGNVRYKAVERYAFGATDPRTLFGSVGAA